MKLMYDFNQRCARLDLKPRFLGHICLDGSLEVTLPYLLLIRSKKQRKSVI
jgi:hypothetical protein